MADYLANILSTKPQVDFANIRDQLILRALNAKVGHGKKANLFTHYEEEGAALTGREEDLQIASREFFIHLDRLAMLSYIGADGKTDVSAVELEIEQSPTQAVAHWLQACNAAAIFPDNNDPDKAADDILHATFGAISSAMHAVLKDAGLVNDEPITKRGS